ncbi:EAL domain-containing protein [Granulosicoccaceae sp. 1_MG-2023]|nr:EAL domain-containing protein [Granulosicoccaceae sp. 1_MG-2023]
MAPLISDNRNGVITGDYLRLLFFAFGLLITVEILISTVVLLQLDSIFGQLGQLSAEGYADIARKLRNGVQSTVYALFLLIISGSVIGGSLFFSLSKYVTLSGLLTSHISDGVCLTSYGWKVKSVNPRFARITGLARDDLVGKDITEAMPSLRGLYCLDFQDTWECEYAKSLPDGETRIATISVFVLSRRNNKPWRTLITVRDITQLKRTQASMKRMAFQDDLTGLANRPRLLEHLGAMISRFAKQNERFAVLYLDLDGFKDINDSMGHKAGDELLRVMSERFATQIRQCDFVARLGGDEFCILLEDIASREEVSLFCSRLLEKIEEPVSIHGRKLRPQSSIGIALFPDDGDNSDSLLQVADTAMYEAKRAGKHRSAFYNPELTRRVDLRLSLEQDLRHAIVENQFELHYQPQISVNSGEVTGVEALIRWRHPQRGLVFPDQFIDIAERTGFIKELGEWVINEACRQLQAWTKAGIDIDMAVNISGSHFQSGSLITSTQRALEQYRINPSRLELEITEGVMQVADKSLANFHALKKLGVNIAIDDFGTGYSSLSSLRTLPVDHLKVDRMFLHNVMQDEKQAVLISTIIGMAHALELAVVVEGVETLDHLLFLQAIGCETVQGFYFSRPVEASAIPELVYQGYGKARQRHTGTDHPESMKRTG